MGLCGAYGALGADLASSGINPAGIGMYRRSDTGGCLGIFTNRLESSLNDNLNTTSTNGTFLNVGVSLTMPSVNPSAPFFSFTFYHQTSAVYDERYNIEDVEMSNSILESLLANVQNEVHYSLLNDYDNNYFYESLAWQAWLIDTIPGENNKYFLPFVSNDTIPVQVSYIRQGEGNMSDNNFSAAYTVEGVFSVGATITSSSITYQQNNIHTETPTDTESSTEYFEFIESFTTTGDGLNLKIGVIGHINNLKLGFAWHSPTRYNLTDNSSYKMINYYKGGGFDDSNAPDSYFEYTIKTPSRIIASTALILGKRVIISNDYERVNYANGKLESVEYYSADFSNQNEILANSFTASHQIRQGIEIRIEKKYRARLGGMYTTTPYSENAGVVSNEYTWGYSFGGEYRNDKMYIGIAFSNSKSENDQYLINPQNQGSPIKQARSSSFLVIGGGLRF
tara:strand:- start:833 stop:2188 length:1356 start_codon:yes stop_codon:yes gene_type:complete